MTYRVWVDDIRIAPRDFLWARSTNEAILLIEDIENKIRANGDVPNCDSIVIDLDHDAGDYSPQGGDYIAVLDWLEATGRSYTIKIHTMNPVGRENMLRIVQKNRWKLLW